MFDFEIIVKNDLRKISGGSIVGDMWNSWGIHVGGRRKNGEKR